MNGLSVRVAATIVALAVLLLPGRLGAQTPVPHVGFLCWVTCGNPYHEAFWQALRKLGYADYKNISFENRAAGGDHGSLATLALELTNLKPAAIVADTTQSALALKNATRTIPLVVIAD